MTHDAVLFGPDGRDTPVGLAAELGYRHSPAGPFRRVARSVAGSRVAAAGLARTLRHLDGAVGALTRGRHSAASVVTGLAVLELTTTGRRTGQPRTSHLIAIPHDGALALLGTNFGQARTPAWVHNLEANPEASVAYRGMTMPVRARRAQAEEADLVFDRAAVDYVGYRHYRDRIGQRREVRVFVLDRS